MVGEDKKPEAGQEDGGAGEQNKPAEPPAQPTINKPRAPARDLDGTSIKWEVPIFRKKD